MSEIEKAEVKEDTVEVYENDIELYLHEYETEKKVKCYDINQMRWNSVLMYINRHVFALRPGDIRYNNRKSNIDYKDAGLIKNICDVYIKLCYEYGKEISIAGFSKLTGIEESTLYSWGSGDYRQYIYYDITDNSIILDFPSWMLNHSGAEEGSEYRRELSTAHSEVYKKLSNERETCLTAMTLQGNIGALAKGKIEKGWVEGQLVLHGEQRQKQFRTPDQIAQDYGSAQLPDKSGKPALPEPEF